MKLTYSLSPDRTIHRMGFGAMRIVGPGVWGPPADRDNALAVLQKAVELGVDFIDTADSYGPNVSEELIAEALYPYPEKLVIATKGGFERSGPNAWEMNGKASHLKEALEGSLKRLKLDQIELYQLHRIDPSTPRKETFTFLQKAQQEGLIKHIGLSEVSIADVEEARTYFEVVSIQNKYAFDYRKWEPELEYCQKNGIAFIPWNPMNANNKDTMAKVAAIAVKHSASPQQVALAWLLQHANNILLIPGTGKVAHLEENMKTVDLVLDADDIAALDALS